MKILNVTELKVEMLRNNSNQQGIAKILDKTEKTISTYIDKEDMPLSDAKKLCDEWNLSKERRAEIFLN